MSLLNFMINESANYYCITLYNTFMDVIKDKLKQQILTLKKLEPETLLLGMWLKRLINNEMS